MPFLVLPPGRPPTGRELAALGARLCPYDAPPRVLLDGAAGTVWGTALAVGEPGRVRAALDDGTAGFEVRAEGDALVVRTDPLGTCPVWYARFDGGWAVAPEAKALAAVGRVTLRPVDELLARGPRAPDWSPFDLVHRLPPGAALRLRDGRATVEGRPHACDAAREPDARDADWPGRLGEVLARALPPSTRPTGAFVSGGIDSSLACALARRQGPVDTWSLGTAHGDEFADARALAAGLGTRHHEVALAAAAVPAELERAVVQNEVCDGLSAEILLQFAALAAAAAALCRRVVTGYGSDLLFDGMLRHAAYMDAVGLATTAQLIERTRWTGELAPFVYWSRGLAARHVFWDPDVMDVALRVPSARLFVDGVEKRALREAAVRSGLLTEPLAFRAKRGLTEGTGCHHLVSEALGLPSPYAYREKSLWCIERLRRAL